MFGRKSPNHSDSMAEQSQPFIRSQEKEQFESFEVETKSSKCWKQLTAKQILYYIFISMKYILFLYFGPLFYTITHEFGHAIFARMLEGCSISIHIGCIEDCNKLIFHIGDFFYLHTLLPFYGYALTNENCHHSLSKTESVVTSMAGSVVGTIAIYIFFALYFTWFRWKAIPINFAVSRLHSLRSKLRFASLLVNIFRISSKFGIPRAIFPFQNISEGSEWTKRVSEESEPIVIFTSYELYWSIFLFVVAVSATFDRLLYGFFPYRYFTLRNSHIQRFCNCSYFSMERSARDLGRWN